MAGDELVVGQAAPELKPLLLEVYNALILARSYVERESESLEIHTHPDGRRAAGALLDRIDGALADAGEVLS